MRKTVRVRLRTRIRHGVDGKRDVEAMLIRLTCGGFHAGSGSHASKDNLRDAFGFQLAFKIRARKCAPCPLGRHDVARLLVQFREEVGESLGQHIGQRPMTSWLLRASGSTTCHIDEHNWETMLPEGIDQRTGALDDTGDRVDRGQVDDALLKVDDDQCCFSVDCCNWHSVLLLGSGSAMGMASRKGSIFGKPAKQLESCRELLLLLSGELFDDDRGQPILPRRTDLLKPLLAFLAE